MYHRLANLLCGSLIFGISVLAFSRCFDYGLINLDDYSYIVSHPELVQYSGFERIAWYFKDVSESIWMPLTWISYAIDHHLFGLWYGGFHIHSVLIHAINAALVWKLLLLLMPRASCFAPYGGGEAAVANYQLPTALFCAFAALAWATHPLRCESVVFLASRKDVLSFFWELLALIAWVRGSRCESIGKCIMMTALSVLFFMTGYMCKPSVMTFPILCLLLDVLVIRRILPLRYLAPFALMLGMCLFAGWQQSAGGATRSGAGESILERLAISMSAFGIYLRNTIMPLWLATPCVKQWPAMPRFLVSGTALSLACAGFTLWRLWKHWTIRQEVVTVERYEGCPVSISIGLPADYLLAGVAWFALAVSPMLGLIPFGYHAYADRFTYIPSFGLALLLAVGLNATSRRFCRTLVILLSAVMLMTLAALTWHQTGFWRSDLATFSRALQIDGDRNGIAHKCLAMYYFEETHELEKAKYHFEKAFAADASSLIEVMQFYVLTLVELGREEEAWTLLREFENLLIRKHGKEQTFKIVKKPNEVSPDYANIAMAYRFARIALLIEDESSCAEAKDCLAAMWPSQERCSVWQYLMYRYYSQSGNKNEADGMLKRLQDPSTKIDYSQFRFLRSIKQ